MTNCPNRRPRLGPAEREPCYTIYCEPWQEARRCAARLPLRLRRIQDAVLEYIEEGWAILRPVTLAAEDALGDSAARTREAVHVCTFIEAELTDLFRGLAFQQRDRVPGFTPMFSHGPCSEAVEEAEYVQRLFHVVALGACDPAFPRQVGDVIGPALAAFDGWVEGWPRVVAALDACEARGPHFRHQRSYAAGLLRNVSTRARFAHRRTDRHLREHRHL